MKNFETSNFGVRELNTDEATKIDGGFPILGTIAAGLVIAAGTAVINDWDNFERGLTGQPYKE